MDKENDIGGASGWPFERVCPVCDKVFSGTMLDEWIYRDKGVPVCSWRCKRRMEIERVENERKAREVKRIKALKPIQKEQMIRGLVANGFTDKEISMRTGFSVQLVNYYRKKIDEAWPDVCNDADQGDQQGV